MKNEFVTVNFLRGYCGHLMQPYIAVILQYYTLYIIVLYTKQISDKCPPVNDMDIGRYRASS